VKECEVGLWSNMSQRDRRTPSFFVQYQHMKIDTVTNIGSIYSGIRGRSILRLF
jgi:hypothetical protein